MLILNSLCIANETERFCLGLTNACFYITSPTSSECTPTGKAVYIKCGMYYVQLNDLEY